MSEMGEGVGWEGGERGRRVCLSWGGGVGVEGGRGHAGD